MSLLDRLEHRFGRYAIPGLIRYVVAFNALVYVLLTVNPDYIEALVLWPEKIMHGEVWRLVTYIFIPQFGSFLLPQWLAAALYLMYLWWIGDGLEHALGSFRLNLYYLMGMIGLTAASFVETYLINPTGAGGNFSAGLLNTSLLFAFAQFYPDEVIFIYFIIPAKVKWLAWIAAVLLLVGVLVGSTAYLVTLLAALSNYFIFFGPEMYRNARLRQQVGSRRRRFEAAQAPATAALHECAVCHRTEISNPEIEFRVSRDGEEYCREHLPKPAAGTA
jgi:hypothetical protein